MSERSDRQTGAQLNERWGVGARHALYIHDGHWYHQLKEFPGALFDRNGYILFETEAEFRNCKQLSIGKDVSVPKPGICAIPGYVRVVSDTRRFWALCANPARYRIREAIDHLDVDHWFIGRANVRNGDAVAVWQTRDTDGHRGVVALGQVVGEPELRSDAANAFWVTGEDRDEERLRVAVRYHRLRSPLWVEENQTGRFLASLSVAKAQGGTVFHLTDEQWRQLVTLAGGFEATPLNEAVVDAGPGPNLQGQGFGLSARERTVIEQYAMLRPTEYFSKHWTSVEDVSTRCSFDLLCRSGEIELRVEVKGTTSLGNQVILTRNEVEEAALPGYAMFVVSQIVLRSSAGSVTAHGGTSRAIHEWRQEKHKLTPIAYSVVLDWSDGENIDA